MIYNKDGKTSNELIKVYEKVPRHTGTNIKSFVKSIKKIDACKELNEINLTATTALQVFINEEGAVESIFTVIRSHPVYDSLAVEASKQARFQPLKIGKKRTKYSVYVSYSYFNGTPDYPTVNGIPTKKLQHKLASQRKYGAYELYEVNEPPFFLQEDISFNTKVVKNNPFNDFYDIKEIEIILNEKGRVEKINFTGNFLPEIKRELKKIIRSWQYKPAIKNGKAVRVRLSFYRSNFLE